MLAWKFSRSGSTLLQLRKFTFAVEVQKKFFILIFRMLSHLPFKFIELIHNYILCWFVLELQICRLRQWLIFFTLAEQSKF